jgi:AcrR family transcriptional regulator
MAEAPSSAALRPPKQPRSRRTLERIVGAALDILEEEGPEGVTVQAVVGRARSSVGSFYARFRGKDDLLEYLGSRVWDEALERWSEAVAARSWSDMGLAELVAGAVGLLFDARRSRVQQLRALDRMAGGTGAYEAFRDRLLGDLEALLLERRDEIAHATPELAVRLALRAILGVVDAGLGSAESDEAASREILVAECRELVLAYLTGRPRGTAQGAEPVDFFDVWG